MHNIRNFCIISHIDHGKSTLADRLLEITKTVPKEKLQEQYLDRMSLERERGITIKMHPVRMIYHANRRPTQTETQTDADKDFLYKDTTYKIRGAAFSIKKNLGLGQKEIIYQRALEEEFKKSGLNYTKEKSIDLWYKDKKLGVYRPDFVIDEKVIVEVKALLFIGQTEEKQLWGYLKNSPYKLALLINFGGKDVEIKRVVYDTARLRESASLRESANSLRESAKVEQYVLNLIDTPGHVDFSYEVSRSLNACEGAILLCDAAQGIQAQTMANYYLAKEEGLIIIPVVNKIDLPNAQSEKVGRDLAELVGAKEDEVIFISAKLGTNVEKVLEAIVRRIPAPVGDINKPLRSLVFDSLFDRHRGVIAFVRIFDGQIKKGEEIKLMGTGKISTVLEVGSFKPDFSPKESLVAGEIGYITTGFKGVKDCRVGDTVTNLKLKTQNLKLEEVKPLKGYREPQPMVFASFYCTDSKDYLKFKEALEKLSLNDAAFTFKSEVFSDLGFGFRCGFLGMLHLEIIKERLEREYGLDLIVTAPSVSHKVILSAKGGSASGGKDNKERFIHSPQEFPEAGEIKEIQEPWVKIEIFSPLQYLSPIMELVKKFRGLYRKTEYLGEEIVLFYEMPLASFLDNFYNGLKNISAGYASLNYHFLDYRPADLVKMDIKIAGKNVDALSFIIPKKEIQTEGKRLVSQLKKLIPRQLFEIAIQAAVGSQIVSRETVPAMRKNVTAKLYGGDRTRKDKLLKKQKAGKKKLKRIGSVDVPQEAFFAILKNR